MLELPVPEHAWPSSFLKVFSSLRSLGTHPRSANLEEKHDVCMHPAMALVYPLGDVTMRDDFVAQQVEERLPLQVVEPHF